MVWFYIILSIVVILLAFVLFSYNSFIKSQNRVDEAFSTMDVYLKKRWDLIPNLVEIVKGYTKFESSTLEEIISLRNESYDSMKNETKLVSNEKISNQVSRIMALAENYPELKADESFKSLSRQLVTVEDEIANARKYYNAVIRIYNTKIYMFPTNLIAKIFGFKEKNMFEIDGDERSNVNVKI